MLVKATPIHNKERLLKNGRDNAKPEMATSSEANSPEFVDLLSQFKCLGTTDRDTLISELFSLLNGQISKEQCAFVLEMANW